MTVLPPNLPSDVQRKLATGQMKVTRNTFDHYELRSWKIGGERVGITRSERQLHIAGEAWTPEQWLSLVDRIGKVFIAEEWLPKPEASAPQGGHSSSFLTRNVDKIVSLKGGIMLVLPKYIPILRAVVLGGANGKRGV
jgi:hypothetical protein